jgi:hypothetical protein
LAYLDGQAHQPSKNLTANHHARRLQMTATRILVGTSKGAFVLTSETQREAWSVAGPHFGGWEIFHAKGSPSDPEMTFYS